MDRNFSLHVFNLPFNGRDDNKIEEKAELSERMYFENCRVLEQRF